MSQLDYSATGRPAAHPAFSIPSILAIIAAVGSFFASTAGTAFLLAIAAGVLGLIGVVLALLPGKRGGIISFLSIGLGAIAVVVAIVRALAS